MSVRESLSLRISPFEDWTEILGYERLTSALLDRLAHRVHILEANGESYRLRHVKKRASLTPNHIQSQT